MTSVHWPVDCRDDKCKMKARYSCLCIDTTIKNKTQNPRATIENPEYSCYVFWLCLRKRGVHGVLKQKGNDFIVLIIRKDKLWRTRR